MLWTLVLILLILWLFGMITATTVGGFLHVLLVIAVIVIIINLLSGRRTV